VTTTLQQRVILGREVLNRHLEPTCCAWRPLIAHAEAYGKSLPSFAIVRRALGGDPCRACATPFIARLGTWRARLAAKATDEPDDVRTCDRCGKAVDARMLTPVGKELWWCDDCFGELRQGVTQEEARSSASTKTPTSDRVRASSPLGERR